MKKVKFVVLKERMRKFNLELEESKSRLIEFGRFAESNCKRRGERKPETFDYQILAYLGLDDAKTEMIRMEELEQARKEVDKTEGKKSMRQNMFNLGLLFTAATLCAILNSTIADFCRAKDECKTQMLYSIEMQVTLQCDIGDIMEIVDSSEK